MCRAVCDRLVKVSAHSSRDDLCASVLFTYNLGDFAKTGERRPGRPAEGGDGHHAAEPEPFGGGDLSGQRGHVPRAGAAALRTVVESDLDEAADLPPGAYGLAGQRFHQPGPVDGMDE